MGSSIWPKAELKVDRLLVPKAVDWLALLSVQLVAAVPKQARQAVPVPVPVPLLAMSELPVAQAVLPMPEVQRQSAAERKARQARCLFLAHSR